MCRGQKTIVKVCRAAEVITRKQESARSEGDTPEAEAELEGTSEDDD